MLYLFNSDRLKRDNLIGDVVCGNLDKEGQDFCCTRAHADDIVPACLGNWSYVEGIKQCQFLCEGSLPVCPDGVKVCDNKQSVERNASNECTFDEC